MTEDMKMIIALIDELRDWQMTPPEGSLERQRRWALVKPYLVGPAPKTVAQSLAECKKIRAFLDKVAPPTLH